MRVTCQEVIIKFRNNQNGQRITLGDGPSVTRLMMVTDSGDRLMVAFLDADSMVRKALCFPMDVVQEYCIDHCDGPTKAP